MQVIGSDIASRSTHAAAGERNVHESLRAWPGSRPDADVRIARPIEAVTAGTRSAPTNTVTGQTDAVAAAVAAAEPDPRVPLLRTMIGKLLGRTVDTLAASDLEPGTAGALPAVASAPGGRAAAAGWGTEIARQETRSESRQHVEFARGSVHTSDGRQVAVELSIVMPEVDDAAPALAASAALVAGFDGTAAELRPTRFRFDLRGDGEDSPPVTEGHGWLVPASTAAAVGDGGHSLHAVEAFDAEQRRPDAAQQIDVSV